MVKTEIEKSLKFGQVFMQTEIKIGRGLSVQLSLQAAHLLLTLWLTLPFGPRSLGGMVIEEWSVLWWEKLKSGSVLQLSRFPTHCSWMIHLFWSTPFSVIEIFSKVTSMASNVESIPQWCNDWIDTCYTFLANSPSPSLKSSKKWPKGIYDQSGSSLQVLR